MILMISENFFGLPDSEMRLWALISTLNFLFPNSWLRQRTTALLLYETDHVSIGGDDEEDDEDDDEFQLPVSPNLQSNLRSRSLSLDDGREKISCWGSRCCWARKEAFCMQQRRLQAGVSGECGDGGQDRHYYCCLGMQRRKTHYKCIQCIC